MIEAIGSAALLGIILSFSLGPVFFELINTSLRRGFKAAFFLEIGVLMSDIIYLIVALFSAEKVLTLIEGNDYFKIIGGSIFVVFGLVSILKNLLKKEETPSLDREKIKEINASILDKDTEEEKVIQLTENVKAPRYIGQIIKGITLNAINPSVLLFWIITCSITIKKLDGSGVGVIPFFVITLIVMTTVDLSKIYFASKLKKHMTPKILSFIGIIIGVIMMAAGLIIIFKDIDIPTIEEVTTNISSRLNCFA